MLSVSMSDPEKVNKKYRVSTYKIGSVGKPETNYFLLALSKNSEFTSSYINNLQISACSPCVGPKRKLIHKNTNRIFLSNIFAIHNSHFNVGKAIII